MVIMCVCVCFNQHFNTFHLCRKSEAIESALVECMVARKHIFAAIQNYKIVKFKIENNFILAYTECDQIEMENMSSISVFQLFEYQTFIHTHTYEKINSDNK